MGDVGGGGTSPGSDLYPALAARKPAPAIASYVANRAKELGILLSTDGPDRNVIKIKPPMAFSQTDGERLVATLDQVLGEDPVRAALAAP